MMAPVAWRIVVGTLLLWSFAAGGVTIDRRPAEVERRTFDPARPPKNLPPLKPGEAALTQSNFDCAADLSYQVVSADRGPDGCRATLKVQGVRVTLRLKVVIWLPVGAPGKLSDHEEGHRQIAERVYQSAESVAKELAGPLDGKVLRGNAADCDTAEKQATQSAADALCHDYLDRIAKKAASVNDVYDRITAHGTKNEPAEPEAIRQAFERADQP